MDGMALSPRSQPTESISVSLAVEGATGSIVISVSADIPGCTDAAASNYNPDATVDDGSCCLANIVTIELSDSFGDGWSFGSGGQWGGFILNGDSTEFASGSSLSFDLCVDEGCYTAQISMGAYGAEGLLVRVPERTAHQQRFRLQVPAPRLTRTSSSTLEAATVWCSVATTSTRATTRKV